MLKKQKRLIKQNTTHFHKWVVNDSVNKSTVNHNCLLAKIVIKIE